MNPSDTKTESGNMMGFFAPGKDKNVNVSALDTENNNFNQLRNED